MSRKFSAVVGAALLVMLVVACEGPQGPPGPQGEQGPAGPQGPQGPPGADANENCVQCHTNNTDLFARQVQYMSSVHFNGGNFERNGTSCAPCHTHEGFLERIAAGTQTTAAAIENPSPVNCRTCHQIHTTYTDADYQFTTTSSFDLWIDGTTIDLGDVGNLCAQCHQPRVPDPAPDLSGSGTGVTFTSPYWGPHHGPQGAMLAGAGAYVLGQVSNPTIGPSSHGLTSTNADACATCHMAEPYGAQAGGHTWNMEYLYHGSPHDLTTGCATTGCHSTEPDDFDLNGVQTDVQAKIDTLKTLLVNAGVMDTEDHAVPGFAATDVQAAALANYLMALEDRSLGVHNPSYIKDLLDDAILAMGGTIP